MKILLLSPLPPPVGGIANWTGIILEHYRHAVEKEVQLVHLDTSIKHRKLLSSGLFSRIVSGIFDTRRIIRGLRSKIRHDAPELIHMTSSASLALFKDHRIARIANRKNIPIVIHFRFGRICELAEKRNWEWRMLVKVLKKVQHVLVLDSKTVETLKENGINNSTYIPNPMSKRLEEFLRSKSQYKRNKRFRMVFIGHMIKTKGIFELVAASNNIKEKHEIIFIGPYKEAVKEQLLGLSKDRSILEFMGVLDKEDIYKELKMADCMVLPSYTEGFPNVILEAMALSCPIIATDVGAIGEIINEKDNQCGLCIPPKNVKELTDSIEHFIYNPDIAEIMAQNAKQKAIDQYTIGSISLAYEKIWQSVI